MNPYTQVNSTGFFHFSVRNERQVSWSVSISRDEYLTLVLLVYSVIALADMKLFRAVSIFSDKLEASMKQSISILTQNPT